MLVWDTKKLDYIQISHQRFYYYTPFQMRRLIKLIQVDRLLSESKTSLHKHVPITLVGIPYLTLKYLGHDYPSLMEGKSLGILYYY